MDADLFNVGRAVDQIHPREPDDAPHVTLGDEQASIDLGGSLVVDSRLRRVQDNTQTHGGEPGIRLVLNLDDRNEIVPGGGANGHRRHAQHPRANNPIPPKNQPTHHTSGRRPADVAGTPRAGCVHVLVRVFKCAWR